MWITLILLTICFSLSQTEIISCQQVIVECQKTNQAFWIRCYENNSTTCRQSRLFTGFKRLWVNLSQKAEVTVKEKYKIQVPPSALRRSRGHESEEEVMLVASVINSTYFKTSQPRKGRLILPEQPASLQGEVLWGEVLFVKAGSTPVKNLTQLIELRFKHDKTAINERCVFWKESVDQNIGDWSTDGCQSSNKGEEVVCSCNHLSFFAVLVNPNLNVDESNEERLSYITYVGSGFSALFAFISLFIYVGLHRRRPEKAISMHMQLTVALFCLHLGFLACSFWVLLPGGKEDTWVCRGLGLFLHWSLVATFTWVALEGFHLYLLLVQVFNIYVRRYLLKLSIVGWGLPTLVAMVCGISGAYGKYNLELRNSNNYTSKSEICWLSSEFSQRELVSYITVGFLCLVVLYNTCMLGLVVFKLWRLRSGRGGYESSNDWKKMKMERGPRLWKDCITVLGLSCVLGLPWGLASITYATLPGIYLFTILNSLQGLFLFLWCVALSCKSRAEQNLSVRDPSSQKMTTTSF